MKKNINLFQFIFVINLVGQQIKTCGTIEISDEEMDQKPWCYDYNYLAIIENGCFLLLHLGVSRRRIGT